MLTKIITNSNVHKYLILIDSHSSQSPPIYSNQGLKHKREWKEFKAQQKTDHDQNRHTQTSPATTDEVVGTKNIIPK